MRTGQEQDISDSQPTRETPTGRSGQGPLVIWAVLPAGNLGAESWFRQFSGLFLFFLNHRKEPSRIFAGSQCPVFCSFTPHRTPAPSLSVSPLPVTSAGLPSQ